MDTNLAEVAGLDSVASELASDLCTMAKALAKTSTTTAHLVDRIEALERLVAVLYANKD